MVTFSLVPYAVNSIPDHLPYPENPDPHTLLASPLAELLNDPLALGITCSGGRAWVRREVLLAGWLWGTLTATHGRAEVEGCVDV